MILEPSRITHHVSRITFHGLNMASITLLEAIRQGIWEEMERDERVFLLGEDIGVYGGAFKVTEGFLDRFGDGG